MNKGKGITTHCPKCETTSYSRNNYFTGKLMLERDFTDEQQYFRDKIRLHHQRLHGTGIVCGLQVLPHENETCRDRYVLVEAGSAIDCCGQDILVAEQETIDLYAFPELKKLIDEANADENFDGDALTHTLQLCIRYRECGAEEIPVLYDDCSCDDNSCAPNRILESYDIDLIIDPEMKSDDLSAESQPTMEWTSTINIANASVVVVDEANNRMFVATGDESGTLHQLSTLNHNIESSVPIGGKALDIALSADGEQLFVILHRDGADDVDKLALKVFDVSTDDSLNTTVPLDGDVPDSDDKGATRLAVAADGRLLAMIGGPGKVISWASGITDPTAPDRNVDLHPDLLSITLSSDGKRAFLSRIGNGVFELDLIATDFSPTETLVSGITAEVISTIPTTGTERHAVLDSTSGNVLGIVNLQSAPADMLEHAVDLTHKPVALVISDGGHWAWVLEDDGTNNYLQPVNLTRLRQGQSDVTGTPIKVGINGDRLTLAKNDSRLYLPWPDDFAVADSGGVAVIDISDKDCLASLSESHSCPSCDTNDCLVLATIPEWTAGDFIYALSDKSEEGLPDNKAWIDNRLGRKVLSSTQDIANALKCVIENCCGDSNGGSGLQGPPGENGKDGINGLPGVNGTNGTNGSNGIDGIGIDPDLPHICDINWPHAGEIAPGELEENGLVIAFDSPVINGDLHQISIQVLIKTHRESQINCWCDARLQGLRGLHLNEQCNISKGIKKEFDPIAEPTAEVDGLKVKLDIKFLLSMQALSTLRVLVNGDFIRGKHRKTGERVGLDADHLPPWLSTPASPPDTKTGDGIEGGTFESWFSLKPINSDSINLATGPAILEVIGDSADTRLAAENILNHGWFSSWDEVLEVDEIGPARLKKLKSHFKLG